MRHFVARCPFHRACSYEYNGPSARIQWPAPGGTNHAIGVKPVRCRNAGNSDCSGMLARSPGHSVRARSSTATGQSTPDRVTAAALRDRRDACGGPGADVGRVGMALSTGRGHTRPAWSAPAHGARGTSAPHYGARGTRTPYGTRSLRHDNNPSARPGRGATSPLGPPAPSGGDERDGWTGRGGWDGAWARGARWRWAYVSARPHELRAGTEAVCVVHRRPVTGPAAPRS